MRYCGVCAAILLCLLSLTAAEAADLWQRHLVTVTNAGPSAASELVMLPLAQLKLPPETRPETLRLIDPVQQRRVDFEVEREANVLRWFVGVPAGQRRNYEVYVSADRDLQPLGVGHFPTPNRMSGRKDAGNESHELSYRGPGVAVTLLFQDHVPYDPDVTQTHALPLSTVDQDWMSRLWRRRIGVASCQVAGRELVAGYWPGHWPALSYYWDQFPYQLSRLDSLTLTSGILTSSLTAVGTAENYAYGWGDGITARLEVEMQPVSRIRVRWTLTADHDLATVPGTERAARPEGQTSIQGIHFFPVCLRPVFSRALWHDEQGSLQRANVSITTDRVYLNARPGGPGWCALYSTDSRLLWGLIPGEWGDGGIVHMAAYDAEGSPANALQMRMLGQPASNWREGESHTWSYWLIAAEAETEASAIAAMNAACAFRESDLRITAVGW